MFRRFLANHRRRVTVSIVVFLMFVGTGLFWTLRYAHWRHPRRPTAFERFGAAGEPKEPQPWWRRMWDMGRELTPQQRRAGRRGGKGEDGRVRSYGEASGGAVGPRQHTLDKDHLALREVAEAQVILRSQFGITEEEAWAAVRQTRVDGPFREYEEQRFVSRLLLMQFLEDQDNQELLRKLKRATVSTAHDPLADFEEIYYAGIGCLLTGEADRAHEYLVSAEKLWPARGRGYGNLFFFLMLCKAIDGNSTEVLSMLMDFQETYPDWLYVETYMPDLEDVQALYPAAPLIHLIQGRIYMFVMDHARAEVAFRQARESGKLDWISRQMINSWMEDIEAAREGRP